MIRMIQSSSANHAKAYFSDALSKADYYINDQELAGKMHGLLAERLDIKGAVSQETFFKLCENVNPQTGKPLTPRTKEERTVGYDINFHCPKSVSLVHVLSKDNHILDAFQASVLETMKDIEADSETRIRKNHSNENRKTGELAWAEFTHQTARPVDGYAPDPHLHSHCFVINATYDSMEKKFKAGQFRDIKRDMPYYQSLFHKRFSDKLIDAGYQIKRTEKSFEIEGVPEAVINLFSKRTNEIGQFAKENNITDRRQLDRLGARTRSKKQKGLSMPELKGIWRRQIQELGELADIEKNKSVRFAPRPDKAKITTEHCINHALQHSFERASVMADRRILTTAFKHGIGDNTVSTDTIERSFKCDNRIINVKEKGRTVCTTKEVLEEERLMVELAKSGEGKLKPMYNTAPDIRLQGQQAAAIAHILTTSHRVSIIRGAAGSGKTTLMQEAVGLIEAKGKKVTVVAPTAEASKGVLVEEGFKQADTVAKFLIDKQQQDALKNQVLWVDEAGLLGTKDMAALLDLTTRKNAQLILGGDTRQHASVIRGDALRILNTVAGIKTAEVNKIYRQQNIHYRDAVQELSKGNVKDGFEKLDRIGSIKNIDPLKPNEALVNDYIKILKKGKTALVISPTHKQSEAVTEEIRKNLRKAGKIGKKEITALKLINLNFTEAQKNDWRNFKEGQIIQFNQNISNIKRGSAWTIQRSEEEKIYLTDQNNITRILPREKLGSFDLFEKREIKLSKGDKIKINRNSFDENKKRLNNGQTLEITSINKNGEIKLKNKSSNTAYNLKKDFGHLTHAHCITSYASQGKTVDHVLIAQPSSTFEASDAKQFYVSVSRGRESAKIYTDDREALLQNVSQIGDRQSALELVGNDERHLNMVIQKNQKEYSQPKPFKEKQKTHSLTHTIDIDYEP